MAELTLRPATDCRYDLVALGEVMLRLDPGEGRVRTARQFYVWEGGGEYNVARGLRRTFDQRTAVVTAFVDNEIGRLLEDLVLAGGVDASLIQWLHHDGVGRTARNGLNFTERGFGVRPALGTSDRGHTAVSQMRPGQIDWDHLFGTLGVRWLHTGGIYAGLSESTAEVAVEAVAAAQRHGTVVSYDPNYRPSLWEAVGGRDRAREVNSAIARHVDVMIGNEQDLAGGTDRGPAPVTLDGVAAMMRRMTAAHPRFSVIATTLRTVHSATVNDWGAAAWSADTGVVQTTFREGLQILDRVGGGDSFASGLIYGLLAGESLRTALEYGAAHGALAMTTPGDASMASAADVIALAGGADPHTTR